MMHGMTVCRPGYKAVWRGKTYKTQVPCNRAAAELTHLQGYLKQPRPANSVSGLCAQAAMSRTGIITMKEAKSAAAALAAAAKSAIGHGANSTNKQQQHAYEQRLIEEGGRKFVLFLLAEGDKESAKVWAIGSSSC